MIQQGRDLRITAGKSKHRLQSRPENDLTRFEQKNGVQGRRLTDVLKRQHYRQVQGKDGEFYKATDSFKEKQAKDKLRQLTAPGNTESWSKN